MVNRRDTRREICRSAVLVVVVLFQLVVGLVSGEGSNNTTSPWKTLNGDAPVVIARGGFSGIFPDSSYAAYSWALSNSLPNAILWCDVQLTKDNVGICFPDLNLNNATDISEIYGTRNNTYFVNGVSTDAWFPIDFNIHDLSQIILTQRVSSRTNKFDGQGFLILTVEDVRNQIKPPGFWLNIQHDAFYTQHNFSMRRYVLDVSRKVVVNYISSPEVNFLKSIASRFNKGVTKLVFRFLGKNEIDPSTNQTYESLLKNLSLIKTFASGIIVPKSYIWPVDSKLYTQPHTSLVDDAHKVGLEVFASEFVNDVPFSYNYSYDPITECLAYIDNGEFSVDGVLSDFPITPSEAIDCFSHLGKNATKQVKLLVFSKNGASGDYPGCSNMAYQKAITDGVDILDCPVQMTKEGIPICLSSIDLIDSTTVLSSNFRTFATTIPQIKQTSGIYAFNLTWPDIQTLQPELSNPYSDYPLLRNPANKNAGNFVMLSNFLDLTKNTTSLSGIVIKIENAAYLAQLGLDVIKAVLDALTKAGYDNQIAQKVMIQSTDSSVLMEVKEKTSFERVYEVDENVRDALNSTVIDITKFANSVVIRRNSIIPENAGAFLTVRTNIVSKLQSFQLPVYVENLDNEFLSQPWDFLADPTVQINSLVKGANVNGVITGFPLTASRYRLNRCLNRGNDTPQYMRPVTPGLYIPLITEDYLPPAIAPLPLLTDDNVTEPPFPDVVVRSPTSSPGYRTPAVTSKPTKSGEQHNAVQPIFFSIMAMSLAALSIY